MRQRKSIALKRVILALTAPVIFLLFAEGVLRLSHYGHPTSFLIERENQGETRLVDNQFFGYRFFPKRVTRVPHPICIDPTEKDVFRVVVLGGSAAMGEPLPEYGLARQLEYILRDKVPGQKIEVINAAMTAINSHVVLEIARDFAALKPDVFFVLMGNNEVVGPFGPASNLALPRGPLWVTRLRVALTRTRVSQLLRDLMTSQGQELDAASTWQGMQAMAEAEIPVMDESLDRVYADFAENLRTLHDITRTSGGRLIVSTVPVNLRDFPPLRSYSLPDQATEITDLLSRATTLEKQNDDAGALALLTQAHGLEHHNAEVSYRLARTLERQGDPDARRFYEMARDKDTLRFRCDTHLNMEIATFTKKDTDTLARLPGEALFRSQARSCSVTGEDFFVDHVHFTFRGNELLATEAANLIGPMLIGDTPTGPPPFPSEPLKDQLLYGFWSQLELNDAIVQRRSRPPFTEQAGNRQQMLTLMERNEAILAEARTANPDQLFSRFEAAITENPRDWVFRYEMAKLLSHYDRYEESAAQLERVLEVLPHRYDIRGTLAMVRAFAGHPEEATAIVIGDDKHYGHFPEYVLTHAAATLAQNGHMKAAKSLAKQAQELRAQKR